MYVAVITILWSWAGAFSARPLAFYAGAATIAMYARVVLGEEPALARRHPEEWAAYEAVRAGEQIPEASLRIRHSRTNAPRQFT